MSGQILTELEAAQLSGTLTLHKRNIITGEESTVHYKNALIKGAWHALVAGKASNEGTKIRVIHATGGKADTSYKDRHRDSGTAMGYIALRRTLSATNYVRKFSSIEIQADSHYTSNITGGTASIVPFKNENGVEEPITVEANEELTILYRLKVQAKKIEFPFTHNNKSTGIVKSKIVFHDYDTWAANADRLISASLPTNSFRDYTYVNSIRSNVSNENNFETSNSGRKTSVDYSVIDLRTLNATYDINWRGYSSRTFKVGNKYLISNFPLVHMEFEKDQPHTPAFKFRLEFTMDYYID